MSKPIELNQRVQIADALVDVTSERLRQIAQEGYSTEHDDEHVRGELAAMAALYAMPEDARECGDWAEALRPEGWEAKFGDRRRDLVKAGALILAEIERLDRLEGGAA
jgi:hypothetical protein